MWYRVLVSLVVVMVGCGWAGSAVKKLNPFSLGKGARIESAWHSDLLKYLYDRGMKPGDKIPKDEIWNANREIFGRKHAPGTKDGFSMYDMKESAERRDRRRSPQESLQYSVNMYKQRGISVSKAPVDALGIESNKRGGMTKRIK